MQFLKTLFWFLLAFILALFTYANWTMVPVRIGKLTAEINLPLLLVTTFLCGLLPTLIYHHAVRWRLRARLLTLERALADIRAVGPAPSAVIVPGDLPTPAPREFVATPLNVPPPPEPRP